MLDSEYLTGFGEVEHIEYDGFVAAVLTPMDRADNLHQRFAFMESAFLSVLANDGQFALLDDAVIDGSMMMPAGDVPYGEGHTQYGQLRFALREIGQLYAIPTLCRTNQFCGCNHVYRLFNSNPFFQLSVG